MSSSGYRVALEIGILVVAHEGIGEALVNAVTHVLGERPPRLAVASVVATHERMVAARDMRRHAELLDDGQGLLILADAYGATPSKLACELLDAGRIELVAGVSLPMLLRVVTNPRTRLAAMVETAIEGGRRGVQHVDADRI